MSLPRDTIRLGQLDLGCGTIFAALITELIWMSGYSVELVDGEEARLFEQVGKGDLDILASAILPHHHAALYAPIAARTETLATACEDAGSTWLVPEQIPASLATSMTDLRDPALRERLHSTQICVPANTPLAEVTFRVFNRYDLGIAGYTLSLVSTSDWMRRLQRSRAMGIWAVFPTWRPHWVLSAGGMRQLTDPLEVQPRGDKALLIAHRTLAQRIDPETLHRITHFRLSSAELVEMGRMIDMDAMTSTEVAEQWLVQNAARVAGWTRP